MRRFDLKFGPEVLATVPAAPGVYRFFDDAGEVVYVGKAKDLRRRLGQYRSAGRGRRDKKPRLIVKDATSLEWTELPTELDASLEELRLIQSLRPRHNVANAFDFLYPFVGLATRDKTFRLVLSSRPEPFPEYAFHGVFRSRETTALAFFALVRLLRHVAHQEPRARVLAESRRDEHAAVVAFRQVPAALPAAWHRFFRGDDPSALGDLAVRLLEKPSARAKAAEVQGDLEALQTFFDLEARPLREVVERTSFAAWPVPQPERDPLFLRYRATC